eukprot:jgi/Undpi1/5304/HiC_scaffold_2.g00585.m1
MNDVFDSMEQDFMMVPGWGSTLRFPRAHLVLPSTDAPAGGRGRGDGKFGMHVDFHETPTGFELTADLPGVRKDDITVDVDRESGVLTVSGERKSHREEKNEGGEEGGGRKYHFVERSYGKTTRSIRLPETADVSKANAEYNSGVLTLAFPKKEVPATARRITIPVGDGEGKAAVAGKASTREGGAIKMTTDGDEV